MVHSVVMFYCGSRVVSSFNYSAVVIAQELTALSSQVQRWRLDTRNSGVTNVGVTRCGNWKFRVSSFSMVWAGAVRFPLPYFFVGTRRIRKAPEPSPLAGVDRVMTLKILRVTLTTTLSASDHVRDVISNSAQTLYALRMLRAYGMPDDALQQVFHSVIVGRLLCASCA